MKAQILSVLKRTAAYDYTLSNGDALAIDVEATFRSVAAQDVTGPAPAEAKEIIAATDFFQTLYNKVADGINTLHSYCSFVGALAGRPKKISEITTPATEIGTVENWSLQIVSGNVSAQKGTDNACTFTTSSQENVEFAFKIKVEDTESEVYSGLLKAGNPITGSWLIQQIQVTYYSKYDDSEVTDDGCIMMDYCNHTFRFAADGTFFHNGERHGQYTYYPGENQAVYFSGKKRPLITTGQTIKILYEIYEDYQYKSEYWMYLTKISDD